MTNGAMTNGAVIEGAVIEVATRETWADKDVLIVSPAPVFPRDFGNRQRIARICERLTDLGARVHFLLYPAEADWRHRLPLAAMQAHGAAFHAFHIVPPTRGLHTGAMGTHHLRDEWWDPAIGTYLDWLTRLQRFDAAIVNYTWLSKALTHLPDNTLKILDTHDQFSGRKELFLAHGMEPEFFYMEPAEEAAALTRADVVWAIKREEAEVFRTLTDKPVLTVPHMGAVLPRITPPGDYLRVGLIGASNNLNATNFERFLDDAVAYVRRNLTQVEITVAGSVCKVLRPRPERFIRMLGYVDRLEDFYDQIDCAVVPMQFSTGLKIKTAEALAFGKPLIALDHAFEGFHPTHPFHTLTTNAEILIAIERLARSPETLADLAKASLTTAAASEAEVQAGLQATIALNQPIRAGAFWLTLNAEECRTLPMLLDQVLELAEFLSPQIPRLGFLFTGPGLPDDDFCARLAWFGPVVLAGEVTAEARALLPPSLIPADPALIRQHTSGVWIATRHAAGMFRDMPPGTVFVAADALAISHAANPSASDADFISDLAAFGPGQICAASAISAPIAALILRNGWDGVLLPFLRGGWSAPFLAALRGVPVRIAAEDVPMAPALAAGPDQGRAMLDSMATGATVLVEAAAKGRAMTYRLPKGDPLPFALEYLVRAGSVVALDQSVLDRSVLDHETLDQALRGNAGWAPLLQQITALVGYKRAPAAERSSGPEPETVDQAQAIPTAAPPAAAPSAGQGPTLGFSRLSPEQTLLGGETRFSQMQVYRPTGMVLDALDVLFLDAEMAGHPFQRLALRFFFEAGETQIFVRRNDCSADAFQDAASVWQEDDWGRFVIYRLGVTLRSSYDHGLAGADIHLLVEALNAVAQVDAGVAPRLSGEVLDRWGQAAAALKTCDLADRETGPARPV